MSVYRKLRRALGAGILGVLFGGGFWFVFSLSLGFVAAGWAIAGACLLVAVILFAVWLTES